MVNYSNEAIKSSVDEYFSALFEPDVMLPSQFLVKDEKGIQGGERRLMAALLSDGVEAYISHSLSCAWDAQRSQSDALDWVETRDFSYVFSFDNVCECLGINPEYLRLGLLRYVRAFRRSSSTPVAWSDASSSAQTCTNVGITAWKKIRRPRKH